MVSLKSIFYNLANPAGYSSVSKLYIEARKQGINTTHKKVKEFLSKQDVYTKHKRIRLKFPLNMLVVSDINIQFACNPVDLTHISCYNNNIKFLLNCIDCLNTVNSKY